MEATKTAIEEISKEGDESARQNITPMGETHDRKEIEESKGYYDKLGFYYLEDDSFYDPEGYFFYPNGYDDYGGYYDDYGYYVPGEHYKDHITQLQKIAEDSDEEAENELQKYLQYESDEEN